MAKRRKRGHRQRKVDAARTPSGQISRAGRGDYGPTAEAVAKRLGLIGGDDPRAACSQDAGWLIGRWYLAGRFGDPKAKDDAVADRARALRDAAERFWRCCRAYEHLLLAPAKPTAVDPNRAHGQDLVGSVAYARRFGFVSGQYNASYVVLLDCGRDVLLAVKRALQDEEAPVSLVIRGLEALDEAGARITREARAKAKAAEEVAKREDAELAKCA